LKSSNGRVLCEACRSVNPSTYMVDQPSGIRAEWFAGAQSVGICGATSTPKWLMEECRDVVAQMTRES
jgi:4-hydroxy-3-methylbut-2-enyl diphosphate reductase